MTRIFYLILSLLLFSFVDVNAQLRKDLSKAADYRGTVLNTKLYHQSLTKEGPIELNGRLPSDYFLIESYTGTTPFSRFFGDDVNLNIDNTHYLTLSSNNEFQKLTNWNEPVTFKELVNYSLSTVLFEMIK